jgi:hypothetical protein
MTQTSRNMMALDQYYVVDPAECPFATRPLSGLKYEAVLHHAEASLQWLIVLVSFVYWLHAIFQALTLTHSFCLQKSDHHMDLKLRIHFNHTSHLFACEAQTHGWRTTTLVRLLLLPPMYHDMLVISRCHGNIIIFMFLVLISVRGWVNSRA